MAHSTHYPRPDTARSRAYDAHTYDNRAEGADSGIYLVIAGLLLFIAAFVYSAGSHDESAGAHGGALALTQPDR
jgi:hypothetical protein